MQAVRGSQSKQFFFSNSPVSPDAQRDYPEKLRESSESVGSFPEQRLVIEPSPKTGYSDDSEYMKFHIFELRKK